MTCRSSGKVRRFAAGTTARYALHAINRKLDPGAPPALHVEAVRDGEEPVSFGPSAALADYGRGWRLQTVTAQDATGLHHPLHADTVPHLHLSLNKLPRVKAQFFFKNQEPGISFYGLSFLGEAKSLSVVLSTLAHF